MGIYILCTICFIFEIEILQHDTKNTHTREQAQLGIENHLFLFFHHMISWGGGGGGVPAFCPPFCPLFQK